MALNKLAFALLYLFSSQLLLAQEKDRYMVFFTDKANTIYSTSVPLEFLSQRALDRRANQSLSVTEEDFPVNADYVEMLRDAGADVYFTSKWMNGVLIEMDAILESTILGLPNVQSIEFVAPGSKLSFEKEEVIIPEAFIEPTTFAASTDTQVKMLNADRLHADGFKGEGMLIAIFDGGFSGANQNAPFQQIHTDGRILSELDFTANSGNPYQYGDHGTRVFSCIGASYDDGTNTFTGTAPEADFILAVTEEAGSEYRVEEYNWLFAAEFADSAGVDVINSSLGYIDFDDPDMDYLYEDMDGETAVITKAANFAFSKGMFLVNSAGNAGGSTLQSCLDSGGYCYIGAPADSPNVLAVGAVTASKSRALFSSFGPSVDGRTKPDISALGQSTTVVTGAGNISQSSGTSFSSPVMAGFVASLWQANPTLTNVQLMNLIKNSGNQADEPDNELGYGIPDYLVIIGQPLSAIDLVEKTFNVYPNPMQWSLTIDRTLNSQVAYQLTNAEGRTVAKGTLGLNENQVKINPTLKSGLYFLRLQSEEHSETIKLLKK